MSESHSLTHYDNLVPLGIEFDLPICLHIPDQIYLVFNSDLQRGYYQLEFLKVNQDNFFDRLGSITHNFRYSKVMVGFPGSIIIPMGPKIDPTTGEKRWRKAINPGSESDLNIFNEQCIQPMLERYRHEIAVCIAGVKPVNRFLSLYRQHTENFFARSISEVDPFLDLDQVSFYYLALPKEKSDQKKIKIRTLYSQYIGSRIPDIPREWNDRIYSKLQSEDQIPAEDEILSMANYCFTEGLSRCAVVELESAFEVLIEKGLRRILITEHDEGEVDKILKKDKLIRKRLGLYNEAFKEKKFHQNGHHTFRLWDEAYSTYRNTVSHEGHLISVEETRQYFSDYDQVFLHLFDRSIWLDPFKHITPPDEETINTTQI